MMGREYIYLAGGHKDHSTNPMHIPDIDWKHDSFLTENINASLGGPIFDVLKVVTVIFSKLPKRIGIENEMR